MTRGAQGASFALAAYGAWGIVPLFWKLLGDVPAPEILAHRVAWSLVFVLGLLAATQRLGDAMSVLRSGRVMKLLLLSSALIAVNWGVFIWAVMANRLVDASLGYFINPLVNFSSVKTPTLGKPSKMVVFSMSSDTDSIWLPATTLCATGPVVVCQTSRGAAMTVRIAVSPINSPPENELKKRESRCLTDTSAAT